MEPKFLKFDTVQNPDTGRTLEYVDKKPCVAMLVVSNDGTKGLFVKQYRAGSKDYIYEVVAGVIEDDQEPIDAVYAELRQEVGVGKEDIEKIDFLGSFYSSVGWTNEKAFLYVIRLKQDFKHKEQQLDEGEHLTYHWVDMRDNVKFAKMYADGTMPIKTALCMNYYALDIMIEKTAKKKKVCIFGGSFNPVTNLHMSMAERVMDELEVDRFIFEPVGDMYEKGDLVSARDRHNMLRAAVQYADRRGMQVGGFEMNEIVQPTTARTLEHYQNEFPDAEIYFMIGSDNLKQISSWANHEELLEKYKMVCIQREGDANIYQDIVLRDPYLSKHSKNIHIIYENATNNISSTKVRSLIKAGKSINWLVPKPVKELIEAKGLYK